jgi:hypothetical protein
MSQPIRTALFIAAILAVTLLIHFDVLFLGEVYSPSGDITYQNQPWRDFYASELKQGRLAVWYPYQACGFPLFAEGQTGMLYPPNLVLHRFFGTWRALMIGCALHTLIAGIGAYFLFRRLRLTDASAFYSALLYMLCGPMIAHLGHFNLVAVASLMPLFLLAGLNAAGISLNNRLADKSEESGGERRALLKRIAWTLWCALLFASMWLAGHPQMTFIAAIALFVLIAAFAVARRIENQHLKPASIGLPLIALAMGTIAASPQLWFTRELLSLSNRASFTIADFASYSFPPQMLATLVHPFVFGATNAWRSPDYHGPQGFVERVCFIGIIPILLIAFYALWRFVQRRKKRIAATSSDTASSTDYSNAVLLVLSISAIVFFLFALGKWGGVYYVLKLIPGYGATRIPARFLFPMLLMLAGIAGIALDRISAYLQNATIRRAAFFLVVLLSFVQLRGFHDSFNLSSPEIAATPIPEAFHEARNTNRYSRLLRYISPAEVAASGAAGNPDSASAASDSEIDTAEEYQDALGLESPEIEEDYVTPDIEFDKPCYPALAGIGSVGWAGELVLKDYKRFFDATLAKAETSLALQRRAEIVAWLNAEPSHVMAYARPAMRGYYLCGAVMQFDDEDAIAKHLESAFPLYLDQVALVVGEPVIKPSMGGVSSVRLASDTPADDPATRQEYDIRCDKDKLFVRTIAYYPGWKAYLDGIEVEVLKVDLAFQGVAIPAGSHKLVFEFAESYRDRLFPIIFGIFAALFIFAVFHSIVSSLTRRVD